MDKDLANLAAAGIKISSAQLDAASVELQQKIALHVQVLMGFSAWLAFAFFIALLGSLAFFQQATAVLAGVALLMIFLAIASWKYQAKLIGRNQLFMRQLGFLLMLTGKFLLLAALLKYNRHTSVYLILAVMTLAWLSCAPFFKLAANNIIELSAIFYLALIAIPASETALLNTLGVIASSILLGAYIFIFAYLARRKVLNLMVLQYALLLALMLRFFYSTKGQLSIFTTMFKHQSANLTIDNSWLLIAALLFLVISFLRQTKPAQYQARALLCLVLGAVLWWFLPAYTLFALLLLSSAQLMQNRWLQLIGTIAFGVGITCYYYNLELNLFDKSIVLLLSGAAILVISALAYKLNWLGAEAGNAK